MGRSKFWRANRLLLAVVAGVAALSAIAYWLHSPSPAPCQLIDGVLSGQSPNRLRVDPRVRSLKWTVIEKYTLERGDPRPRYDVLTVALAGYRSLGVIGELELHLFNDRLASTRFRPHNLSVYLDHLEGRVHQAIGEQAERQGLTYRGARIYVDRISPGNVFVRWEDPWIVEDESAWIRRYS